LAKIKALILKKRKIETTGMTTQLFGAVAATAFFALNRANNFSTSTSAGL
jgi:hypothetical protein